MTKTVTRKASIPNDSGDIKQSICDFNVIHAVQMDIEMYNIIHAVFKDFFSGKLALLRRKSEMLNSTDQLFSKVLKEKITYTYVPPQSQIESDLTRRSNSDILNNYNIDVVTKSFTDIEDVLF
jgi:hypothetical protein